MLAKNCEDYFLGLDMGTSSIGWAVTDTQYNLLKFNGKALWGIRLFEEANAAAEARGFRTARRRLERRRWRVKILQEFFAPEIAKVDPGFFQRLQESRLKCEDKENPIKYNLFIDSKYTDIDFHNDYPTMYHLRQALIKGGKTFDVRLVYLAIQHIIKYRGHFLFGDLEVDKVTDFQSIYEKLESYIQNELDGKEQWECGDPVKLSEILSNVDLGVNAKKKQLGNILPKTDAVDKAIIDFLSGAVGKLDELFSEESLKDSDKNKLSFRAGNFDELEPELEVLLGERIEGVLLFKAVYDWSLLANILQLGSATGSGVHYISDSKIAVYEQHKEDLVTLKKMLQGTNLYNAIFRKTGKDTYAAYREGIDGYSQSDFCKTLRKQLESIPAYKQKIKELTAITAESTEEDKLLCRINAESAFPKQTTKDNGVIPMQLHLQELKVILANAVTYLPFLAQKDSTGKSIADKIIELMEFRIPYYVGPLAGTKISRAKHRCWVVRKVAKEKIYPWNFEQVVDLKASAEKFITNMTAKCSYLPGEDVLPKASLLYSEFMVRNALNILTIDGARLPVSLLDDIYEDLFIGQNSKVTEKRLKDYIKSKGHVFKELGGIDKDIKASLRSYKDFERIFGRAYVDAHTDEIENIIRWITLFADEKKMLVSKIKDAYPNLPDDKIQQIKRLKYKDWGRLSKTLLDSDLISKVDASTGEKITIISALRNSNNNFMELLSKNNAYGYDFSSLINNFNSVLKTTGNKISYKDVEDLYVSPKVKRSIWQTLTIVNELVKIIGKEPKRIFIEMARSEEEKVRTVSRKDRLLELYKNCKDDEPVLCKVLEGLTDEDLRQDRLYLYFTQMGKCMYTGERINISQLHDTNVYDIDHIYPQSKTKDDSLNNRVLVLRKANALKKDVYPLSSDIRTKMRVYWDMLFAKGLIERKKYDRLIRKTGLTDEELAGFINRQLVETRQSTKAVAEILKETFVDSEIVYSKAGNVSEFRHTFGFIKNREVNDYHHAKDAYLNIVVGNTHYVKFTKNPLNFFKSGIQQKYSLKMDKLYAYDIERSGEKAWVAGDTGSMATVQKTMRKNNILFTRMPMTGKGALYKINPLKAGKGQLPLKKGMSVEKYGGYDKLSTAYFALVESVKKKSLIRTLEAVPLILTKAPLPELIAYLARESKLQNPKIIIPKISKYALVSVDGFPIHLTGKTGSSLIGYGAVELVLLEQWVDYLKKIIKYKDDIAKNEALIDDVNKDLSLRNNAKSKLDYYSDRWKISKDNNLLLYDVFIDKCFDKAYCTKPAAQGNTLRDNRDVFIKKSLSIQIKILLEILNLFKCASSSADFTLLTGKGATSGRPIFSNTISNKKSCVLINQSPTGVFEEKIDLLKV